jgi:hypothetical protein
MENVAFVYPCQPFQSYCVDTQYQEEFAMARAVGLNVHFFDIENIPYSRITPPVDPNAYMVYRGWMLSEAQYTGLEERFGNQLVTSKQNYYYAHHLPHWYESIKPLTIPSIITDEEYAQEQFLQHFSGKAFIKDYVKSLKTGSGSIVTSRNDISRAIADMKFYRGIIEGGIVLREVVSLKPNSERRFFVVRNKIFNSGEDYAQYCLVEEAVKKLEHKNIKFYSIDVATMDNGKNIIIEVGDGQVSDYPGWSLKDFMNVLTYLSVIGTSN